MAKKTVRRPKTKVTTSRKKKKANPIPKGFHTVTPHLVVANAKKAIAFYKKAFGAILKGVHYMPDGKTVMHAEMRIGDSVVMLNDEFPDFGVFSPLKTGATSVNIHLYVKDVDKVFKRAVSAGATVTMPLADAFWGDRYAQITDPSGHKWSLATHLEDLTPKQMDQRAKEFFAQAG